MCLVHLIPGNFHQFSHPCILCTAYPIAYDTRQGTLWVRWQPSRTRSFRQFRDINQLTTCLWTGGRNWTTEGITLREDMQAFVHTGQRKEMISQTQRCEVNMLTTKPLYPGQGTRCILKLFRECLAWVRDTPWMEYQSITGHQTHTHSHTHSQIKTCSVVFNSRSQ